jgi:HAE1 family hydrophobic/amphiphilic exporter-1
MLLGTVIGVLVIPGLYYLFGGLSDGRKLLRDETDEPLSERVEQHLPPMAEDEVVAANQKGPVDPPPAQTGQTVVAPPPAQTGQTVVAPPPAQTGQTVVAPPPEEPPEPDKPE